MQPFLDQSHLLAFAMSVVRSGAWLLLLLVIFLPLEHLFALHRQKFFRNSLALDLGYYFISSLVPALLLALPFALIAYAAHSIVPQQLHTTIAAWPLWQRVIAALLVGETGFYWGHRWCHEIPWLWRFHSIHHSAEHIYFLTSSRAHPIDNVFTKLCGFAPVTILGIATPLTPEGGTVAALLVLLLTMWGFFIHSNLRWRFGPLEWLVATPAFHHWHHSANEQRNRNYAPMLPWIDWIFGTLHLPRDHWPKAYGIETKLPETLVGQLVCPLRSRASQHHQ